MRPRGSRPVVGSSKNKTLGFTISAPVSTGAKALMDVLRALDEAQIHPSDIGLKRPSLDDVFMALTGHVAEEEASEPVRKKRGGKK